MKKILFIFIMASLVYAEQSSYILGLRSSKYGYIAYQNKNNWGIAFENSIFIQDVELQYARTAVFYTFSALSLLHGSYAAYYGSRYNQDYYDIGTSITCAWDIFGKYLQVDGIWQPFYDSDIGLTYGYSAWLQTIPLNEVGVFGGIKNLPDSRDPERRFFAGLVFDLPHMLLKPEVSTPLRKKGRSMTRVMVNFTYKAPI